MNGLGLTNPSRNLARKYNIPQQLADAMFDNIRNHTVHFSDGVKWSMSRLYYDAPMFPQHFHVAHDAAREDVLAYLAEEQALASE